MTPRAVLWVLGRILRPFSALFLIPAAVDLRYGAFLEAAAFAGTALLTLAVGWAMSRARSNEREVGRIEAMGVVAGAWLATALLGAVPFLFQGLGFVDGFFESMSGFTTTGATIFQADNFVESSRGLMFWRALSHWLGGLGIIVLFVAVLPALAVAGRQMFFAEAPGPEDEALTPRIRETAARLWKIYGALTLVEYVLLRTAGEMGPFDSICHAFATMAAGGFSPYERSLEGLPTVQWIVLPFMFLAGASFTLQYRALRKPSLLLRDPELRTYAGIVLVSGLLLALLISPGRSAGEALRHGFFQATSILTTTGFASTDFNEWGGGALIVLGALFFVGGCAGSAGGGPKVVRLMLLGKFIAREVLIALHPRAVRRIQLGGRAIPRDSMRQVVGFLLTYFAIFVLVALLVGLIEADLRVGITGSIACLGNVGPGYGAIGPMGSYGGLHAASKVLLTLAMWIGRLEVMTVLILLHPDTVRSTFRARATRPAAKA